MARDSNFWKSLGSPRFVLGPMVDQSELAFSGAGGAFFSAASPWRTPLAALPSGSHTPEHMVAAGRLIEDTVAAVDVNLGCPQGIARRGFYGAYLLQEPELIISIVSAMHQNLAVPVTCKMRKVSTEPSCTAYDRMRDLPTAATAAAAAAAERHLDRTCQDTLLLAYALEAAGAAALTLHGRTKDEKGRDTGEADWGIIRRVKSRLEIPVIANGGVETHEDAVRCLQVTGADAVMAAEAILDNPSLFREASAHLRQQALQQATAALQPPASSCMEDLHSLMNAIVCYYAAADGGAGCFNVDSPSENNTWYRRHRRGAAGTTNANEGASDTENTDKYAEAAEGLGNLFG
ncbi:tRNA-dihydrouridine(16/17) synthase [NAD(P)(+)] [Cyclospora cayetanensis]|uniref:tRNA-dihydrouridine(16/17) synthase [NAD(P)(+)] n=1 Tax=Cyclospora cayetanensis TaxID=88456 RepID=A0A6P6S3X1_9EIME|nr:tRNA-dihydrouridine(16/17) synthase [NAD(P)(+)] [Cyclospora cayetanensis]